MRGGLSPGGVSDLRERPALPLPQSRVQIGQEGGHLFVGEAPIEARHQSPARQHYASDFRVCSWNTAGQRRVFKDAMQIRWNLLEGKIVFFVAMRATNDVEVLAGDLLARQFWRGMATNQESD